MLISRMTFFAFDFFHKYVSCMAVGLSQCNGALCDLIKMAHLAAVPWGNPAVLLLGSGIAAGDHVS